MTENWLNQFDGLGALEPAVRDRLLSASTQVTIPAGETVFRPGDECQNYLLMVDGRIKVQMTSESGREIVLYRVEAGETCVLTTSCLLANELYNAEAVTENTCLAIAVPSTIFRELMGQSEALRDFVFKTYGTRIADLLMVVEEVAFKRLDIRLAAILLESLQGIDPVITQTHQQLATELGTAREVISRQLKDFERRGWITLQRGRITVLSPEKLKQLAENSA